MTDSGSNAGVLLALSIAPGLLMLLILSLRLYTRAVAKATLWIDDWLIIAAGVLATILNILAIVATRYGAGTHLADIEPQWSAPFAQVCLRLYDAPVGLRLTGLQIALADSALFAICITITKISICFTYLRIFPTQWTRWFCYSAIVFVACLGTTCTFLYVFQCRFV
jgi:hypothetical protein